MKKILTTIIISLPFLLSSQNLKLEGEIFDYTTGVLLKDVKVELYKGNTELEAIQTDLNGKFQFSVEKGNYRIVMTKIMYSSLSYEVTLTENKTLSPLFLQDNTQSLEEVLLVIRKKNISIDNKGTTLIIDESPFFEGINVLEAINIMPGVMVSMDGSISVLGKRRILTLVNGRETNLNISDFSAKNIEKIVIDSSPSAKYDASYDVVLDITLKKWVNQGVSGRLNSSLTLNKRFSQNYGTSLNYNKNKINVASYFAIVKQEDKLSDNGHQILNQLKQVSFTENEANRTAKYASINLNYDIYKEDKIGLEFDILDADSDSEVLGNIKYQGIYKNIEVDSSFVSNSLNKSDAQNYSFGGFYSRNKETYTLDASFKYFKITSDVFADYGFYKDTQPDFDFFVQLTEMKSNSSTFSAQIDYEKTLGNKNTVETGIKFTDFNGDFNLDINLNNNNLSKTVFDFNERIYAYYVSWKGSFDEISILTGIRLEYFDRKVTTTNLNNLHSNKFDFFPTFSIDYTASENSYYQLSYVKRIKRPGFNQITPFEYFTSYNTKFVGNTYLKDEMAHNLEFLYYLKQKYYFSLYLNYNRNSIEQTGIIDNDFITINKPINYDYYSLGFQTGFSQNIRPWLTSTQKISIERVTSEGMLLDQDFKTESWEANFYLAGIVDLSNKGSFTLIGNYFTPQYFDIYKVKQGFKLDLRYSLKFLDNNLTATLITRNLLNTYFNEVSSSHRNQSSFYDKNLNNRDIALSLSYVFDKGRKKNTKKAADNNEEAGRLTSN